MNTIGSRIAENRRRIGMTQEELAAKLAVSAQAVSKWENDITCPDVMTLPKLAELLGITVDELLSGKKQPQTLVLADEERKSVDDDMMLKIIVNSHEGDKVKVNLPIPLVKAGLRIGMGMPQVKGNAALESIDFGELIALIDSGVIGKLVEVESADGDIVEITVE